MNRRQFARNVGVAALFSPFLSLLRDAPARAADGRAKYLLIFFTPGTDPAAWHPAGSTASRIAFSAMTEPLAAIKDNLVLVDRLDSDDTAAQHDAPGGLTGRGYANDRISVEQFASDRLREAGVATSFPNLLLGSVRGQQQSTFFRAGQALLPEFSPRAAYDTLFAASAAPENPGEPPSNRLARRQSALDLVRRELAMLSRDLPADERQKLELHAESVRQLEGRLTGTGPGGGGGGGACASAGPPVDASQDLGRSAQHLDLALTALGCDMTRIAAVQFGHHQSTQVDMPEVGRPGDWHNSYHHSGYATELLNLERWLCGQFVRAVEHSKTIPLAGGGTLFDETLFVWARDMGDALTHKGDDMRFVFAGGAGGYLRRSPDGCYVDGRGERHQRALFTCLDALGITQFTGFGDPVVSGASRTPLDGVSR